VFLRCVQQWCLRQCRAMTLADAGTDAGPLWLRISIAFVPPALAAIIAGYVALSNTVNRRAERLKNLNDIRVNSDTESINPEYAVERIMLRELKELDRATTPKLKWEKRFRLGVFPAVALVYSPVALWLLNVIHLSKSEAKIMYYVILPVPIILIILAILFIIYVFNIGVLKYKLDRRYSGQFAALDERTAEAQESSDKGKQHQPTGTESA
jgi:hypothetical protein